MRTVSVAVLALTLPILAPATPADAASSKRSLDRGANARSVERARAENVDPSGVFKGYPDWARIAFASGRRQQR